VSSGQNTIKFTPRGLGLYKDLIIFIVPLFILFVIKNLNCLKGGVKMVKTSLENYFPWQFYGLDYSPDRKLGIEWYKRRAEFDNYEKPQLFRKAYIDIEVYTERAGEFPDPLQAKYPIVLISLSFSDENKTYAFVLFNTKFHKEYKNDPEKIKALENDLERLINTHYSKLNEILEQEKQEVEIRAFFGKSGEKEMIKEFWELIKARRPFTIAGYYSDGFDFPYIFNRMKNLKLEPNEIITEFGEGVEFNENTGLGAPEFMFVDALYIYKPGEGLGFGDTQETYELDNIANVELGIKKVELTTEEGKDFDLAYEKYIEDYIFYNIVDTLLVKALDKKLNLIYQYNSLRRMSKSLFKWAYRGATKYGEDIIRSILRDEEKEIRSFIPLEKFPNPQDMNLYKDNYFHLKVYGAYVREPKTGIHAGLNIDFDQSLTYDQLILVKRKNGKLEEVPIGKYRFKEGDRVFTLNEYDEPDFLPVRGKIKHRRKYNILVIETENGARVKVTENHSIFVFNEKTGEIELTDASKIKKGAPLILPDRDNLSFFTDKVKKVERFKKQSEFEYDYVYDISVEKVERFFARDPKSKSWILVHNTSMYPSIVLQYNIDFTTLRARLFPLRVIKAFNHIKSEYQKIRNKFLRDDENGALNYINETVKKFIGGYDKLFDKFIEWYKPQRKNELKKLNLQITKTILFELFSMAKLYDFEQLINPVDRKTYLTFKTRLIPFLENLTHIYSAIEGEINRVIYYWILSGGAPEKFEEYIKKLAIDGGIKDGIKFVIQEFPTSPKTRLRVVGFEELVNEYLQKYIATITGALFYRHDEKLGLMVRFINHYMSFRKQLKKLASEYYEQGDMFKFEYYNNLQGKVVKPQLNAMAYGITIVPTFVLNDKSLGNTITLSGRFMIKFAQYGVQVYLSNNLETYKNNLREVVTNAK